MQPHQMTLNGFALASVCRLYPSACKASRKFMIQATVRRPERKMQKQRRLDRRQERTAEAAEI